VSIKKPTLEFYVNVFDETNNLIISNIFVGKYKSNTWAMHKACSMYPDYHNFELFTKQNN
jgi:hypothetical protein